MAKLFSKTQPLDVDPDEPEVDARIRQLETRRVADTFEIVDLEKKGLKIELPDPRQAEIGGRVALLLGDAHPSQPNSKSLADLYLDREGIDVALGILHRRSISAHSKIVDARCADRLPAWIELQRHRALLVAALRRLNAESDQFIADLASGGLRGNMPNEFPTPKLLGTGNVGVDAIRFLDGAVRAGIVTTKELENA